MSDEVVNEQAQEPSFDPMELLSILDNLDKSVSPIFKDLDLTDEQLQKLNMGLAQTIASVVTPVKQQIAQMQLYELMQKPEWEEMQRIREIAPSISPLAAYQLATAKDKIYIEKDGASTKSPRTKYTPEEERVASLFAKYGITVEKLHQGLEEQDKVVDEHEKGVFWV